MSKAAARNYTEGFAPENTPHPKCKLRQQTNRAPNFIETAAEGETGRLMLRFSHTAEHMAAQADIANVEAKRVQEAVKKVLPSKKDLRQFGGVGWGDSWQGRLGWSAA